MESERDAGDHEEIVNWGFSQKCEKKAQYLFWSGYDEKKAQYLFCSGYDEMRL